MSFQRNINWLNQTFPERYSLNNRVHIGSCSYGDPEIKTWEEDTVLEIGKFCSISTNVTIFLGGEHRGDWVSTYPFNALLEEYYSIPGHPRSKGDVIIGNDVWIAHGATILSGVTIGDGAIIGCNSLVTRDVPPYGVVAGNPGKLVKYRFDEATIKELLGIRWWDWDLETIEKSVPLILNNNIQAFIDYAKKLNVCEDFFSL